MNFRQKWIHHLKENNMTYVQHFIFAAYHGIRCVKAGLFLIFHAIMPALFAKTGSDLINELNKSFISRNEYLKCKENQNV
jgi:hypothetical protein